ncbi:YesL family protein [Caldanaerobius polysaccharolyticus]|uniref:YesL family protein n=1 Tax=Caldanaerobius polysaccharolyticus TaxID=44256 RepID=UPI00047EAD27|nr:DUF624 domain-containing protein [Caldanaerobius polysaccharolyticus]
MLGGFFNRWYYGNEHRPDLKEEDIPKGGAARFFDVLRNHFWKLVQLNLLLVVFSIPVVTIGPALAGFNYVLRNYSLGRPVWVWSDFKDGALKNLKESFAVSLINAAVGLVLYVNFKFYSSVPLATIGVVARYLVLMIAFVFVLMNVYIFPLLVTYELRIRDVYKNAFIFTVIKLPHNIGIVLLCIAIAIVSMLLAYLPFFLISLSLMGLLVNVYCRSVFYQYIDKKVEQMKKEQDVDKDGAQR